MKKIYKYKVSPGFYTQMPKDAYPLSVGQQGADVVCWALIDTEQSVNVGHKIAGYGTGWAVEDDPGRFIGTVQMDNGLLFHFFDQG